MGFQGLPSWWQRKNWSCGFTVAWQLLIWPRFCVVLSWHPKIVTETPAKIKIRKSFRGVVATLKRSPGNGNGTGRLGASHRPDWWKSTLECIFCLTWTGLGLRRLESRLDLDFCDRTWTLVVRTPFVWTCKNLTTIAENQARRRGEQQKCYNKSYKHFHVFRVGYPSLWHDSGLKLELNFEKGTTRLREE